MQDLDNEMEKGTNDLWFTEALEIKRGIATKIKVKKVLEDIKTDFQSLAIFETDSFGKVLVLDGVIQLTEFDESGYQEMIVHPGLCVHPNPKKILVIGGGDGGVVREIVKHPSVEQVDMVEIDEKVIETCKKHIPSLSCELDNPKVKIFYEDGAKFVKEKKAEYDVAIVDSSDPIGPAKVLFKEEFYKDLYDALNEEGLLITQCESMFYHKKIIKDVQEKMKKIFPVVSYYYTLVPTYPSGMIGFSFASKKYKADEFKQERFDEIKGKLRYYNSEIHKACFVLPEAMKELVE